MPWPAPADPAAAERLIADFSPLATPALRPLLACLGGNSPYLADLARAAPECVLAVLELGPDAVCDQAMARLAIPFAAPRTDIAAALRTAKRQVALVTALADIGGWWTLERVTGALSDLADAALRLAVCHLLHVFAERGEIRLRHPQNPAREGGFVVLGMGKLGARELNYSSDIDLVLLFDPCVHDPDGEGKATAAFARLSRALVSLMETRELGGYVFRTDLRLRPDPASTPPAVSLPGAILYYENMAQTWERAAMIKARPVAGDLALGRRFLDTIRPFIWRRMLDFAAIADIRAMKGRVDAHKGTALGGAGPAEARLLGHDLKLGEGGIREIEFCAQTLQLVWGGRDPALRVLATLPALSALVAAHRLPAETARVLDGAYRFLRQAEHRLQMVADRQTHTLPDTPERFAAFAVFMATEAAGLAAATLGWLTQVHALFDGLLRQVPRPPDAELRLPGGQTATLRPDQFAEPARVAEAVASWQRGEPRSLRSERARALLAELLPEILAVMARQPDPDAAFARFDRLIGRLPEGVQLLSMIQHNPALLDRMGDVLGAAPFLADHLAEVPAALEGLLSPQDIDTQPKARLTRQLADSGSVDDALAIASRTIRGEEFRLAVAELDGRIDVDRAGRARTDLADAAISTLLPIVMADHARRYGRIDGGMVVVALGKAGSREMMAGSDLDLMLVYDHGAGDSSGRRPLAPSQYFARAAQALVAALTVRTRVGPLYAVDMRLRPSGSQGPVAVSLPALRRYYVERAWTWERMALTRARVVAGPRGLAREVAGALAEVLRIPVAPGVVFGDAAAMRRRLLRDLPAAGAWDVKLRHGGLIDVEFVAQALSLVHPGPTRRRYLSTTDALARLARDGALPAAEAQALMAADRLWRSIQGMLRIESGRAIPATLPPAIAPKILRAAGGGADLPSLLARLEEVAATVRGIFAQRIGAVDG